MAREGSMSVAGIVQDPETQSRVIPESRRADGSIRKERKVKPGFTPAEDVGRFRPSRVLEAQQRQARSIPGYEPVPLEAARKAMARTTISSSPASPSRADGDWRRAPLTAAATTTRRGGATLSSSSSRGSKASTSSNNASGSTNWRRRETSVEKVPDDWEHEEEEKGESVVAAGSSTIVGEDKLPLAEESNKEEQSIDDASLEEDDIKKARTLKKKVRAAQALQEKHKQNGESLLPEQQAKVDSLDDMIRDLKALGVSESQG